METVFKGKIWKFGDDIDTDTIIPGKRGTIPTIEEMKKYAFELLKPEFGSTVQPGDILVAGRNFGCGSSREQAATVLSGNGVRCIIARSFARIFFRNAFNRAGIWLPWKWGNASASTERSFRWERCRRTFWLLWSTAD